MSFNNKFQIEFTQTAQTYLKNLLEKQEDPTLNAIVYYIENQGTHQAETCLSFFNKEDSEDLIKIDFDLISIYSDQLSLEHLKSSQIDYIHDDLGGEIKITAPNAKKQAQGNQLTKIIEEVIEKEINPQLNLHKGSILLKKINDTNDIIYVSLQGGCQGCSMAKSTLVEFIEKIIKQRIPQITSVKDITDHSIKDNAFF